MSKKKKNDKNKIVIVVLSVLLLVFVILSIVLLVKNAGKHSKEFFYIGEYEDKINISNTVISDY